MAEGELPLRAQYHTENTKAIVIQSEDKDCVRSKMFFIKAMQSKTWAIFVFIPESIKVSQN